MNATQQIRRFWLQERGQVQESSARRTDELTSRQTPTGELVLAEEEILINTHLGCRDALYPVILFDKGRLLWTFVCFVFGLSRQGFSV